MIGHLIAWWFGTTGIYILSGLLVLFGALFYRKNSVMGIALLCTGIGWGSLNYGHSTGGAYVTRQWQAANAQAAQDAENRDIAIARLARDMAEKQANELATLAHDLNRKVLAYEKATKDLSACRRATADDKRRLLNIARNPAPRKKSNK
jgi:hypothetical protein